MVNINSLTNLYLQVQNDLNGFRFVAELYDYVSELPETEEGRLKAMYALGASWSLSEKPWK